MAMRYGAITSRRGTRREIGRMSAAGDQGEAQRAWQEVEKRDKAGVATRGANRGARRGRERDFHNTRPKEKYILSQLFVVKILVVTFARC